MRARQAEAALVNSAWTLRTALSESFSRSLAK